MKTPRTLNLKNTSICWAGMEWLQELTSEGLQKDSWKLNKMEDRINKRKAAMVQMLCRKKEIISRGLMRGCAGEAPPPDNPLAYHQRYIAQQQRQSYRFTAYPLGVQYGLLKLQKRKFDTVWQAFRRIRKFTKSYADLPTCLSPKLSP